MSTRSVQSIMNSEINIRTYRTVINEVSKKYENTREFVHNKLHELCSEHGISAGKVRLYIFMFVMLRTQFSYVHSLERIVFFFFFALK